jgi:glucose-6-phosphate 1-dehydrogenase
MKPKPRPGDPCILVIFGAVGDLTKRLLVPALGNLRRAGLLPTEFAVIGISRKELDNEVFRRDLGLCRGPDGQTRLTPNDLILRIQPEEGMTLRFSAKTPGPHVTWTGSR